MQSSQTRRRAAGAESLVDAARQAIEQMILTGVFEPGDRVNELALAEQLKVSRGPVREALRAIAQAGLITTIRNRGAVVRTVTLEDALDLYDLRAGFARTAGRLLARRATQAQVAILERLCERMTRSAAARNTADYYRLNLEFHARLLDFAGNPRLVELETAVRNELQLYLRQAVLGPSQLRVSNAEHAAIVAAVAAGDAERAGREFEQHVLTGKQRMLDNLARHNRRLAG